MKILRDHWVNCRHRRSEFGTSLVELLVVVTILTIVSAVAMAGLISGQNTNNHNAERVGNLDQARLLMDNTTKDLRTAVRLAAGQSAFLIANATEAEFTATLDATSAPVLIDLKLNTATLRLFEYVTTPDAGTGPGIAPTGNYTYSLNTPTTRYVAEFIANTATQPMFTYNDNQTTPPGGVSLATTLGANLTAAQMLSIHAVVVDYWVRHTTKFTVAPTELITRVRLPNLDYNPSGSFAS